MMRTKPPTNSQRMEGSSQLADPGERHNCTHIGFNVVRRRIYTNISGLISDGDIYLTSLRRLPDALKFTTCRRP